MAQTTTYGLRYQTVNPASSIWDYISPPNDPEPGPDGKFHWRHSTDHEDQRRKRWRGRYPPNQPIAFGDTDHSASNVFEHIRTRGPDGEFIYTVISKGAKIGLKGAMGLGKMALDKFNGPTDEDREIMKEIAGRDKEFKEWEAEQAKQRNHLAALDRQAEQAQHDSIHGVRETLHKNWGEAASSSSASAEDRSRPSKTFSHPVSKDIETRGNQIRQAVIDRIGGMTPNREARLIRIQFS